MTFFGNISLVQRIRNECCTSPILCVRERGGERDRDREGEGEGERKVGGIPSGHSQENQQIIT